MVILKITLGIQNVLLSKGSQGRTFLPILAALTQPTGYNLPTVLD